MAGTVFNANGGAMRETYGVPVEEIVRGIKHGVRKVNIDTDLRLAAEPPNSAASLRHSRKPNSIRANSSSPQWTRWPRFAATASKHSEPPATLARSKSSQ
jgi:hypothetical protein